MGIPRTIDRTVDREVEETEILLTKIIRNNSQRDHASKQRKPA